MQTTYIQSDLSVGAQIEPEDLKKLKEQGFTDIVCNRPDAEHPDGPVSKTLARTASALGLAFHYLPIVPGEPMDEPAAGLAKIVAKPGTKVFAYCRSGARSTSAWQLAKDTAQAH